MNVDFPQPEGPMIAVAGGIALDRNVDAMQYLYLSEPGSQIANLDRDCHKVRSLVVQQTPSVAQQGRHAVESSHNICFN